ncbi:single myb histone 4-like [Andrographis paniculata]|uniref:single myb histone 4-like n=1 Tax=Andrographis paniculata TaxID=175694 RepID=UPI0021E7B91B|nr:single myb histone 4-like [Andrographis paniculata]
MGNQKQKWTAEEEAALRAGVEKHGVGKWKNIIVDAEFAPTLVNRSNVDLKDKWRNMGANQGNVSTTPKVNVTTSTAESPKTGTSSPVSKSKEKTNGSLRRSSPDGRTTPTYSSMIAEALSALNDPSGSSLSAIAEFIEAKYEVHANFRRLLSSKLGRLAGRGKIGKCNTEHGHQRYKLNDSGLNPKLTTTPAQRNVKERPFQQPNAFQKSGFSPELTTPAQRDARPFLQTGFNQFAAQRPFLQTGFNQFTAQRPFLQTGFNPELPSPAQWDFGHRPFQQSSVTYRHHTTKDVCTSNLIYPSDTIEDAASIAARCVAEAENKAFVAAQAMKESDRVMQLAEDALVMQTLCEEFLQQCSQDGYISIN